MYFKRYDQESENTTNRIEEIFATNISNKGLISQHIKKTNNPILKVAKRSEFSRQAVA